MAKDNGDKIPESTPGAGTGKPKDKLGEILFAISSAAHDKVKSQTVGLTSLLDADISKMQVQTPPAPVPDTTTHSNTLHRSSYSKRLIEAEPTESALSPAFAKDYARIIHSPSFRRLQGKTQLIPSGENDFFRTRLTHSLEVAEIASRIALRLNERYKDTDQEYFINPDIVVCASLLHDIGHPPFGHSGEEMLNVKMAKFGGFEGNAQTLRIVTNLESRLGRGGSLIDAEIKGPRGLNLTVGTLSAILKYDFESHGPIVENDKFLVNKGYYPSERDTVDKLKVMLGMAEGVRLQTLECQVMDIADDIAYSAYNLEDTLEAGIVAPFDLMSIDDRTLSLVTRDVNDQLAKRHPDLKVESNVILYHLSNVFGTLILDGDPNRKYQFDKRLDRIVFVGRTYAESQQHARNPLVRRQYLETLIEENIESIRVAYNPSVPCLSRLVVDANRLITIEAMKAFNFHKVISSRRLQLHHHRAKNIIAAIFDALAKDRDGHLLSEHQRYLLSLCSGDAEQREREHMRLISDIVSAFTDSEALRFYDQLQSSRNTPFLSYNR